MKTELTGKQRRYLRGLAHEQKPVIQIGHGGVTKGVLGAVDAALETHELIKVKVLAECPEDVDAVGPKLERGTRSAVAQAIGRILVVYRRRAENPTIDLPDAQGRVKAKTAGSTSAPAKRGNSPSKGKRPRRARTASAPSQGSRPARPRTASAPSQGNRSAKPGAPSPRTASSPSYGARRPGRGKAPNRARKP